MIKNDNVSINDFKLAMKAHNENKESPCFNENYNTMNKLGSVRARQICRSIANATSGNPKSRITMKLAIIWARSLLPVGKGYPAQDINPFMEDVVIYLRALDDHKNRGARKM